MSTVSPDESLQEYRRRVAAMVPPFLLPRRFTAAENWTKAATEDGNRYVGLFREQEPGLAELLGHTRVLIIGEPGAGKSTAALASVQHVLNKYQAFSVPVFASLKSYDGVLRSLLLHQIPATILDDPALTRTYVLDGIDEVSPTHRDTLRQELDRLITGDAAATYVLTTRQAFHVRHPEAFPENLHAYHILNFDDKDIRAFTAQQGVTPETFLAAVREIGYEEEIRNPFALKVVTERYRAVGQLSPYRNENVKYVVDRLIDTRQILNPVRQRRALKMLAITCETSARNELKEEEALRVLTEAIDFSREAAVQLLEELSQSILIRMPGGGISFQMRSYGEYLAAEELHDKSLDRLMELAFIGNDPVDSWLNAVTYLAEMNDTVRRYFARHHPTWLISVSEAAFTEEERTTLTKELLRRINDAQSYLVEHRSISLRKLSRLLTPTVIAELREQLTSMQTHEAANALVLLGVLQQRDIIPSALDQVTAHRNTSQLRYSAIVALVNAADNQVLPRLIAFTQHGDAYYINLVDTIGSLCTPNDFPAVLPLLENTKAGLSAAFYHFRELTAKEALVAAIAYLTQHPATLQGYDLDSYLEPIIDLIPIYWGNDIAAMIGELLAALERATFHRGRLAERIIDHVARADEEGRALQSLLHNLARDGTRLQFIDSILAKLITTQAAQWIIDHAPTYAADLVWWLPAGPAREILAPQAPQAIQAQEQARELHRVQEESREREIANTRQEQQATIGTNDTLSAVLGACLRLQKEHWPEVSPERKIWFTEQVSTTLQDLDLAHTITWETDNRWTHPGGLEPLLKLTDYYNLTLTDDVPVVLALRSWANEEITSYYRRHGLSTAADAALAHTLDTAENDSIIRNIIAFIRNTGYDATPLRGILERIALDPTRPSNTRTETIEHLATIEPTGATMRELAADPEQSVREHAFRHLIISQHEGTIRQAIATLTDDQLRHGEVAFPETSSLDWIGKIAAPFAVELLRPLRQRTLALDLFRVSALITSAIAAVDKTRAATIIRQQLPQTPEAWRQHLTQEADKLERTARIAVLQQTPFDQIIRKLKGATSMIRVKVFCEGSTDRPIFRELFREIGEDDIAKDIGLIGGWGNLLAEREPEHYLDGCREAIVIMDGDNGRKLRHRNQPFTDQSKEVLHRFRGHRLTLHVLRSYGIENYFPQHACESVLRRNLNAYFPIPPHAKIEDYFCAPKPLWPRWLNRVFKRKPVSFYQKRLNQEIAALMTMRDLEHTDLAQIIREVQQKAQESRRY